MRITVEFDSEWLWQQILDAARDLPIKPIEHPQYIEGMLYVTPEQYRGLWKNREHQCRLDPLTRPEIPEIPVTMVRDGEVVDLPNGKSLVYLKALESLVIFDKGLT